MSIKLAIAIIATLVAQRSSADVIKFRAGGDLECTVIQETSSSVTVIYGSGLLSVDRSMVESIKKDESAIAPCTPGVERLPNWASLIQCLGSKSWATAIEQTPATVVDTGTLAFVPYKSHKCGGVFEVNVYGDPEHPSGIEVGVYGDSASKKSAQDDCEELVRKLLKDPADASTLAGIDRAGGTATREGLVFEITPPTAEDSFGAWWISIYDPIATQAAKASAEELKTITVASGKPPAAAAEKKEKTDRPNTKPATETPSDSASTPPKNPSRAVSTDTPRTPATANSKASRGSGTVYVRGYYRKNGTYVKGYTRHK
jgi:hypothetical protein